MPHFKNMKACKPFDDHRTVDDWLKQDWNSDLPASCPMFFSRPRCLQTQALKAQLMFYGCPVEDGANLPLKIGFDIETDDAIPV